MLKIDNIKEENLNPIIVILMKRDNLDIMQAINYFLEAVDEWKEICSENPEMSYDEACDFIEDWFGLESDYLMDFICDVTFD